LLRAIIRALRKYGYSIIGLGKYTKQVTGLGFSRLVDGTNLLVSSSLDGTVLVWDIGILVQEERVGELIDLLEPNRTTEVDVTERYSSGTIKTQVTNFLTSTYTADGEEITISGFDANSTESKLVADITSTTITSMLGNLPLE